MSLQLKVAKVFKRKKVFYTTSVVLFVYFLFRFLSILYLKQI